MSRSRLTRLRGLFILLLCAACSLSAIGQKKSRALQKLEQERKQLLKNIEASDKKLQQLRKDTRTQEQGLRLVEQQVEQRKQVVEVLGNEVSGLQARIDTLSGHIGQLHRREGALLLRYRAALLQLQKIDTHVDPVLFILSSGSPSQARERQRFLSRYTQAVKESSIQLKNTRSEIEAKKAEVGKTHAEKEQLLSLREGEKRKLEQEQAQRSAEVKSLKGQQQQLAQDLSKQRQRAEALDRKIQQQVEAEILAAQKRAEAAQRRAEERRRRRAEAQAKKSQASSERSQTASTKRKSTAENPVTSSEEDNASVEERRAATPGGYAMDANERALASSFAQNKGRLPAPIRGAYSILRTFGLHQHSQHSRVQVNSSGVDFGVQGDGRAYAVFSGVVSRVFVIPGYGTAVILRHGNYLTVYANLSSVSVSSGSRVSTGQTLGAVGATPDGSGGRLLHFQLWHERTKLNPLAWIKR